MVDFHVDGRARRFGVRHGPLPEPCLPVDRLHERPRGYQRAPRAHVRAQHEPLVHEPLGLLHRPARGDLSVCYAPSPPLCHRRPGYRVAYHRLHDDHVGRVLRRPHLASLRAGLARGADPVARLRGQPVLRAPLGGGGPSPAVDLLDSAGYGLLSHHRPHRLPPCRGPAKRGGGPRRRERRVRPPVVGRHREAQGHPAAGGRAPEALRLPSAGGALPTARLRRDAVGRRQAPACRPQDAGCAQGAEDGADAAGWAC